MIRLQGIQFCNSYLRSENEDGDLMHDGMNIWDPWSFGSAQLLMGLGKCSATMYNKVKYHTIQISAPYILLCGAVSFYAVQYNAIQF